MQRRNCHQRECVSFRLYKLFEETAHGGAARSGARNLRNQEAGKLQVLVALAVTNEAARGLLGSHHAGIPQQAAMNRMRIVEVDGLARKVGAVIEQEIEVA